MSADLSRLGITTNAARRGVCRLWTTAQITEARKEPHLPRRAIRPRTYDRETGERASNRSGVFIVYSRRRRRDSVIMLPPSFSFQCG